MNNLKEMNKDMIKALFPDRYELLDEGKCPTCKKEIDHEREFEDDDIAMREFVISGLCKGCQSKMFLDD